MLFVSFLLPLFDQKISRDATIFYLQDNGGGATENIFEVLSFSEEIYAIN